MLSMDSTRNAACRSLAPLALLGFEAGAVTVLHRLGSVAFLRLPPPVAGAWREWLRFGDPADVLAALVRAATLGAAWWLLVSTILYLAARLRRSVSGVRLAGLVAPAVVRRCVDGMVAVSVAGVVAGGRTGVAWAERPPGSDGGIVLRADVGRGIVFPLAPQGRSPAAPAPTAPAPAAARTEHDKDVPGGTLAPDALLPAPPSLAIPPSPSGAGAEPPTAAGGQQAQEPSGANGPPGVPLSAGDAREGSAVWTVRRGESLWTIAAAGLGARPSDARSIGPYWVRVVAANRGSIASGNPDLIRPGEAVVMPPPGPPGRP
jgi:nucleoid-associated protein YgaU